LIVDDERFNLTALKQFLINMGVPKAQIIKAVNGKMAIEMIEQNVKSRNYQMCNFSLILMDCNMPICTGYDATNSIREFLHMHKLKQPIITGVTGHT